MAHTPYIALYPSDYLADTAHLGLTEHGIYWRLLLHYYQHRKPLPADLNRICRIILAMTPEEKRTCEHILAEYFALTNEPDGTRTWHHKRADREIVEALRRWEATQEISSRKSLGGQKSAETRKQRYGSAQPRKTRPQNVMLEESSRESSQESSQDSYEVSLEEVPKQPEPEPEPEPDYLSVCVDEVSSKKNRQTHTLKTPLPENFGISSKVMKWAEQHGFNDLEVQLDAFRNKAAAHGYQYADWDRAFMEAVRNDWAKVRQQENHNAAHQRVNNSAPARVKRAIMQREKARRERGE